MKRENNTHLQSWSRKVKKCVLAFLIAVFVIFAVLVSVGIFLSLFDRLTLVRWTMNSDLPEWLKAFLWGWY